MVSRYHRNENYSYTLGIAPTIELLERQLSRVTELICSAKAAESEQVGKLLHLCRQHNIPVEFSDKKLSILSNQENTYVAGVFNKYAEEIRTGENFLVLAQPSDAGNIGTIMRTMVAFGYRNLAIIEPAIDAWDPKVIRASMGAIFQLNFHLFPTYDDFRQKVTNAAYMFTKQADTDIKALKPESPFSLVFGSEGSGLTEEYMSWGQAVKISQSDDVDSLNLAIAAGIAMHALSGKV